MGRSAELTPMAGVSPKQIEQARQRAIAACNAAYAPQSVPQPSTGALSLCWMGRIARAYQMLQNSDNPAAVRQAIKTLEQRAQEAFDIAEKAASDYAALCASVGVTAEDVYPPTCECEGCRLGRERQSYANALAELRTAAYALLLPAHLDAPLPALVELVEATGDAQEHQRKELWQRICRLAKAQKKYREASLALNQSPDWQGAFR